MCWCQLHSFAARWRCMHVHIRFTVKVQCNADACCLGCTTAKMPEALKIRSLKNEQVAQDCMYGCDSCKRSVLSYLCRIFRSCTCFRPRHSWTNQSSRTASGSVAPFRFLSALAKSPAHHCTVACAVLTAGKQDHRKDTHPQSSSP